MYLLSISPNKSLNKKNICNLRTSEIPNCVTYECKHLESNCSGVNKNGINKNDNFCNTLQKPRVNNPLRIIVGQLNINSIRNKFDALCSIFKQKIDILLVSETKIDDTFAFYIALIIQIKTKFCLTYMLLAKL